jgi:hypothetical protein
MNDHRYLDEKQFISRENQKTGYYLLKLPFPNPENRFSIQLPQGGAIVCFKLIDYMIDSSSLTPGSVVYLKIPRFSLDFQNSTNSHRDRIPIFFDRTTVTRQNLNCPYYCWLDVQQASQMLEETELLNENGSAVTYNRAFFLFEYTLRYDTQLRGTMNPDALKRFAP